MATTEQLTPPPANPNPAPPGNERLVTDDLLYLNQGTTYRLGSAFAGNLSPTSVWQQMIDNSPYAMTYYRELEAKDDDISAAVAEAKLSVLKRGWEVSPGDESAQAEQAAQFVRDALDSLPDWRNVLNNLLDSPFYGFVVAEMMFDASMGQAMLTDIVDCPQELFCFAPSMRPQIGPLQLKTYAYSTEGVLVPEQKFVVFTSRARHGNRMGSPILREIYWDSWFKRNVQRFWLRYAEKGPGTAVVTYPNGAGDDDKRKALAGAEALMNDVAVAVPETFKVLEGLLQGTRTISPEVYEKLYNILESKIYRRVVGGTLTSHGSDGGKGTQALGNVHQESKEERSVELCLQMAAVINRQIIRPLVLWNFGPDCPVPQFGFNVADEADLGQDITVADTLQEMGLEIPEQYAYEHFGIPRPENGEPTLTRPVATPAAIVTPAGAPDKPQFSRFPHFSDPAPAGQRQAERDTAALDKLFAQFRGDALEEQAKRVRACANAVSGSNLGS